MENEVDETDLAKIISKLKTVTEELGELHDELIVQIGDDAEKF